MATNAKLWGTGGSAAEDVTKTNCSIIAGYPSVLTAQSNYLIRSVTASPAAQKNVTLTAAPASNTEITFSSAGVDLLGTKILSFFIHANGHQFSGTSGYVIFLCGDAATDGYFVSSVNPAVTTNPDAGYGLRWSNATEVNKIYVSKISQISLVYSGTNGDLTITISGGLFDTDDTYTGVFRVVDES